MLLVNLLLIIIAILAYGHRQARIAASTSDDADINAISNESLSPLQIKNGKLKTFRKFWNFF